MKIDGLGNKTIWEQAVSKRLKSLRQRLGAPRKIEHKYFSALSQNFLDFLAHVLPRQRLRGLFIFTLSGFLLLFLLLGLRELNAGALAGKKILGAATTGVQFLQDGKIDPAFVSFQEAANEIADSNDAWVKVLNILPLGVTSSDLQKAAEDIVSALRSASSAIKIFQQVRLVWDPSSNSSDQQLYDGLKNTHTYFQDSLDRITAASEALSRVNLAFFPSNVQVQIREAQSRLNLAQTGLRGTISAEDLLLNLLGGQKKSYMLIFQNNNEARATGGFIGTYGLADFDNGRIQLYRIDSIYNPDGQLKELIAAPGPLQRQETSFWGMRDSNWFVDFSESSRKILSFLQKETGIEAQGVISFTPDVFEKFLALTGPIPMPQYGVTLTAENFRETVQYKTSIDYDKQLNQPKKFLADFAPLLLSGLTALPSNQWLGVLDILAEMVAKRQILMYSSDPELESAISAFRADGAVAKTSGDYLAIFNSNVGGGKTDQNIQQKVEKQINVISGGTAIVDLKITRTHQGFDEKYFPKNVDFMRVLVPPQAQLLSASGFDDAALSSSTRPDAATDSDLAVWDASIKRDDVNKMYTGQEAGHTFFANWLELDPGQTKTVELKYEISFDPGSGFTEMVQKQPGAPSYTFVQTVNYLPGLVKFFYPPSFSLSGQTLTLSENIDGSQFYGVIGE
jgi:hypothetical protein